MRKLSFGIGTGTSSRKIFKSKEHKSPSTDFCNKDAKWSPEADFLVA